MKIRLILTSAAIMAASAGFAQITNAQYTTPDTHELRSLVFNPGDEGSKHYRIPGLTVTKDGALLAVIDKRWDNIADLPAKIDVVARRSTDGGLTWGPHILVAEHDSIGGYGDPAVVVDNKTGDVIVISTHGNGLWQETPGHISVSRSTDNGLTWEPAIDINPQILTTDANGKQPIKCCSAFASSGRALQLRNGRIIFALVTRQPGVENFPVYAIYSDDHGKTWHVSKNPATTDGDESKIVELADGTLLMSIRNRWGGGRHNGKRIFAVSTDHGTTWSEPQPSQSLHAAACNGSIIRYTHGGKEILLHSLPAPGKFREDITIYKSLDNGKTWQEAKLVSRAPGAYSSMAELPDGSIGILTEEGIDACGERQSNGYRIWFTRLPKELLGL